MPKDKRLDAFFDSLADTGIVPSICTHHRLTVPKHGYFTCKLFGDRKIECGGKFKACELED